MTTHNDLEFDLGSFRDPAGRVFRSQAGGGGGNYYIYRTLSAKSVQRMRALIAGPWFKEMVDDGRICETVLLNNSFPSITSSHILRHKLISPVTYPYEWSFYMLKDAALLTLELMLRCLENGFILKDGTAWNITVHNGKMCFFDILSIEYYREGQTWDGYGQFCQEFLYPLMIKSYFGLDFHNLFKGSLGGIETKTMANMTGFCSLAKPGVLKHIILRNALEKNKTVNNAEIRNKFSMPKSGVIGLVKSLIKVVLKLKPRSEYSVWLEYDDKNSYENNDIHQKEVFVSDYFLSSGIKSVIDFGCNTGHYSGLASADCKVFACDMDSDCIDVVYKKFRSNVVPIVLNLMNPSPYCGWDLVERKSIKDRVGQQDGFLALALIHHICIVNNVPLEYFVALLRSYAPSGVVEWVSKEDPMVKFLLRNREDVFDDYNWDNFSEVVSKYFIIKKNQSISNGTRTLCLLEGK